MRRLRLVVDTNVVVSAALKPASLPAEALFYAIAFGDLYISRQIFEEYEETLAACRS